MDRRAAIERSVAQWQARVAALEADYHRRVGPARAAAGRLLRDELGRFMTAIKAEGVPASVTARWVTDLPAYHQLVAVAEAGIDSVTTEAVQAIRWAVAESAQLGKPAADALTAATIGAQGPGLAAAGAFGQVNVGAVAQLVGQLQAASPLVALPGLKGEAVQAMQRELVRGLANGQHSRTIGRAIEKATDMPAWRAATIARTEIHRAYRESNRMAYQANPMVGVPKIDPATGTVTVEGQWRWMATLSARTCSACWAMHGTLHDLSEPMGSHPNCRCSQAPVVSNAALRAIGIDAPPVTMPTGEQLFAELPKSEQLQILGPDKYQAYQAGKIKLADTVHVRETAEWGTTRSVASLDQALGARA